jgi:riboflavin synthase
MVLWDGSTGSGVELTVRSKIAVSDASIGCSIAVNGVCLTATSYDLEKVFMYHKYK